jgi:hypothetical protein
VPDRVHPVAQGDVLDVELGPAFGVEWAHDKTPFVSSEVETRWPWRVSTSLDTNGGRVG